MNCEQYYAYLGNKFRFPADIARYANVLKRLQFSRFSAYFDQKTTLRITQYSLLARIVTIKCRQQNLEYYVLQTLIPYWALNNFSKQKILARSWIFFSAWKSHEWFPKSSLMHTSWHFDTTARVLSFDSYESLIGITLKWQAKKFGLCLSGSDST